MSEEFFLSMFLALICLGMGLAIAHSMINLSTPILLSQETGDDICHNLTANNTSIASSDENGKLVCEIPSFDSTQNIIVKENNK